MRIWRMATGDLLVEGPAESPDWGGGVLRRTSGEPLAEIHVYYVLAADGAVRTIYKLLRWSDQEWWGVLGYLVEGDELREYSGSQASGPPEPPRSPNVRLSGLSPVAEEEVPVVRMLDRAVADFHQAAKDSEVEGRRKKELLLASFRAALPARAPGETIKFLFQADVDGWLVVRAGGGPVVWRDSHYPYQGKDLFAELEKVLQAHYGRHDVWLENAVTSEFYLRFNDN